MPSFFERRKYENIIFDFRKKILIKILLIIFLPNSAFAAVKSYLVTCEGTVTITSSKEDKERDIFYDDLDFYIVTNNKSKETYIQEIVLYFFIVRSIKHIYSKFFIDRSINK